jgi:rhodanese-related sulfurtransferase
MTTNMTRDIGDLSPQAAFERLRDDPAALLVDVRTDAEWAYVGAPDLTGLAKQPVNLAWQLFPTMAVNGDFVAALSARVTDPARPLLFLCRSGVRSLAAAKAMTAAGYQQCFNIAGGFEGDRDGDGHRGRVNGWKAAGLPWRQG